MEKDEFLAGYPDGRVGGLAAIVAWSGLKGNPLDERTQAGSLLSLCGVVEDQEFISIAEAGSIDPDSVDIIMTTWSYEDEDGRNVNPNIAVQGRARSFFRAAAIAAGTCWSRQAQQDYDTWTYRQMSSGGGAGSSTDGPQLSPATHTAMELLLTSRAEEIADAKKDHVALSKTVDVTKERTVPLMGTAEYNVCWNRFKAKMEPGGSIRFIFYPVLIPSLAPQM